MDSDDPIGTSADDSLETPVHAKRKLSYNLITTVGMTLLVGAFLWGTFGFDREQAKQFPRGIALFALGLLLIQIAMDVRSRTRSEPAKAVQVMDLGFESDLEPRQAFLRVIRSFGWVFGVILATIYFGYHLAVSVLIVAYLRLEARLRWRWALLGLGVIWFVVIYLFGEQLRTQLPRGRWVDWQWP